MDEQVVGLGGVAEDLGAALLSPLGQHLGQRRVDGDLARALCLGAGVVLRAGDDELAERLAGRVVVPPGSPRANEVADVARSMAAVGNTPRPGNTCFFSRPRSLCRSEMLSFSRSASQRAAKTSSVIGPVFLLVALPSATKRFSAAIFF